MYYKTIRSDVLKTKATTLTTMLFVAAAAMLVSLAAILVVNLLGAIETLMTQAETPHFMQMHSGDIDISRLTKFAEQQDTIEKFQVLEFLNVDGSQFVFGDKTLANSVQDNGLCVQSDKFDYLLDLDGNVINVSNGELYVPLCYMRDHTTKVGDRVIVSGQEFTVAGFLRDSMMNSTLSSSKRFLVSEQDYAKLYDLGSPEYLIEFRLKDISSLGAFQTAYISAGLEANGPSITQGLFIFFNAISDGLMIGVILLVSILVVSIAFLCIRFTLLAKIEDDYREIGVMKAIGLRVSDIKKIYLAKYTLIAAVGCMLGFALAFVFKSALLENIRLFLGESKNSSIAISLGAISVSLVFLAIIAYVNGVLKRFRTVSSAEAIRFGASQEKVTAKGLSLSTKRVLNTNIFLGLKDVITRKKLYGTMLTVLVMAAFIIIVPQNLYNTISSRDFCTYMGIGTYDMRIDIQQTENISAKAATIVEMMNNDTNILKTNTLTTRTYRAKTEDGSDHFIKIELGDHSVFPLKYTKGRAPFAENEIALSSLYAKELNKNVGDVILVFVKDKERELTVCGIYSDITNGGKSAKSTFSDDSTDIMWCIIGAELVDESLVSEKTSEYANLFAYSKVSSLTEFISQTFGSTMSSVDKASQAAIIVSLFVAALVTLLFTKMLVAKDRYSITVMKAFGFRNSDITLQYVSRTVFVLVIGIALGTLLANTAGSFFAGLVISSLGASAFNFEVNALSAYVFSPLMMAFTVFIATLIGTLGAGKVRISESIKE